MKVFKELIELIIVFCIIFKNSTFDNVDIILIGIYAILKLITIVLYCINKKVLPKREPKC